MMHGHIWRTIESWSEHKNEAIRADTMRQRNEEMKFWPGQEDEPDSDILLGFNSQALAVPEKANKDSSGDSCMPCTNETRNTVPSGINFTCYYCLLDN